MEIIDEGKEFFFKGSGTGCLLIHGFTGTTSSMKPMGEYLSKKGLTVLGVRLPGHGTCIEDFTKAKYHQWIDACEDGLRRLKEHCDKIFVSGLSLGGTLTLI